MNAVFDLLVRSTLLLTVVYLVWRAARSWTSEARCALLRSGLIALAALPFVVLTVPSYSFDIPWMRKPEPLLIDSALVQAAANWQPEQQSRTPWAIWIWIAAAGAVFVPCVAGYQVLRRRWRSAKPVDAELSREVGSAMRTLGVRKAVPVRIGCVSSPLVFGALRPHLLLPKSFQSWPEEHRRSALLHEAAHVRRFDCAWLAFATLTRAVYLCHPLVWWLSRALRDETELAADERAIRSGVEATDYASALVAIARELQVNGKLVRSQGVTFMHHRQLENRVRRALAPKRRGFTTFGSLGLSALALAMTLGLGVLRPQTPKPEIAVLPEIEITEISMPEVATVPQSVRVKVPSPKLAPMPAKIKSVQAKPALAPIAKIQVSVSKPATAPVPPVAKIAKPAKPAVAPSPARIQSTKPVVSPAPNVAEVRVTVPAPATTPQPEVPHIFIDEQIEKLGQGKFSEAEAIKLRALVEKAIQQAQREGMTAEKAAIKMEQEIRLKAPKVSDVPIKAFTWTSAKAAESMKSAQFAKEMAKFKEFRLGKIATTTVDSTGITEIMVTDQDGKKQVIKLKPGTRGSLHLERGPDGKVRIVE